MQVNLQNSVGASVTPSPLQRGGTVRRKHISKSSPVSNKQQQDFPDSPLISTRPVRYNVQLNEQITSVQRADSYLRQTENQLLQLRHLASSGVNTKAVTQQAEQLNQWLQQRNVLSAGTVDRQLRVSLDGKSQVEFVLDDIQSILQNREKETLIFSLGGNKRELSAIQLHANSSAEQILLRLNQGLGRWGIHGRLDKQQITFYVDEQQWERVNTQLSVRGEGQRYPMEEFYPVQSSAEEAIVDQLAGITTARRSKNWLPNVDQALEQITQQRRRLTTNKERIQQRIEGMATYKEAGAAIKAAKKLSQTLSNAATSYPTLNQALAGQANVNLVTVRNLLG